MPTLVHLIPYIALAYALSVPFVWLFMDLIIVFWARPAYGVKTITETVRDFTGKNPLLVINIVFLYTLLASWCFAHFFGYF